jgi:hypothetical protein
MDSPIVGTTARLKFLSNQKLFVPFKISEEKFGKFHLIALIFA